MVYQNHDIDKKVFQLKLRHHQKVNGSSHVKNKHKAVLQFYFLGHIDLHQFLKIIHNTVSI